MREHGEWVKLIGIDAGEAHRAKPRPGTAYPLVEHDIDRDECLKVIANAGLPEPAKSGCWCCPYMRTSEVIELIQVSPCRAERIEQLEARATNRLRELGDTTESIRCQFRDKPMAYWRKRASQQNWLIDAADPDMPCDCYDGG